MGNPRPAGLPFIDFQPPAAAQAEELSRLQAEEISRLIEIQTLHEDEVLSIPGVVGIGIGKAETAGQLEYKVFVTELTRAVTAAIPAQIEGVPASIVVTGEFVLQ